jgi:hypothetical protein
MKSSSLIILDSLSFRFQKHLAHCDFIDKQKGFYSSYWDTGVYGNYFHCEPSKVLDVIKLNLEGYKSNNFNIKTMQIKSQINSYSEQKEEYLFRYFNIKLKTISPKHWEITLCTITEGFV